MSWVALTCPQCSAPLPRVALWRAVKCASCGSLVTKTESMVRRDSFRQALARAREASAGSKFIECGGARYQVLETLGAGEISTVYFGNRVSAAPMLVTIKVSAAPGASAAYAREGEVLRGLQALDSEGAGAFFTRLLPVAVAHGAVDGEAGRHALVLKHPVGFWGSLAALHDRFANGLDPRHGVWIWRRMLEALGFVHRFGWAHKDVRPEHALVHLGEHAVRLIGWREAKEGVGVKFQAEDLCRSARVVQVLLSGERGRGELNGDVPAGLAKLVNRAAEDRDFCREHGAEGLDALLREEARSAFGPPKFVPLTI